METERRSLIGELADIGIETRDAGLQGIRGYAAVYYDGTPGTEFRFGKITERILPGAFSRSLDAGADVLALFNHNVDLLLGRRSTKTLRLYQDDKGLRYSVDVPSTSYGRDLLEMISRGDIKGSSFAFTVNGSGGESWRSEGESMVRELRDIDLHDVSPVVRAAYDGASVDLRSALDRWNESRVIAQINKTAETWFTDLAKRRLRLIELQSGL